MEHILISPGKLKLMLTKTDVEHYELDPAVIGSEDTVTRGALRELLSDLKAISGFDAADDKVFIQLYPSKDGGAELYITRLTVKHNEPPSEDASVRVTRVYAFDSMQALLDGCARIGERSCLDASSAWHGNGRYYLLCEKNISYRDYLRGEKYDTVCECISDCGACIRDSAAQFYVKEHCLCFCEKNAIETLARMA